MATVKRRTASSDKGVVRFKTGFPPRIRDYIRKNLGDSWHLELRVLDGDDGDGDDGDPGPGSVVVPSSAKRASSARSAKKATKSRPKRRSKR
jgi:hypothetical protein